MSVQPIAARALQNAPPRRANVPGQTAYRVTLVDDWSKSVYGGSVPDHHPHWAFGAVALCGYGCHRPSSGMRGEFAHRGGPRIAGKFSGSKIAGFEPRDEALLGWCHDWAVVGNIWNMF